MTNITLINELNEIFKSVFEDSSIVINPSTSSKEIHNWDSMHHIILISEIEKHFGIEFELDDLTSINKVEDIISALKNKIKE